MTQQNLLNMLFTSRSTVFDEFCKQMRFLLFVLVGNVYDGYDCVPV